MAVVGEAHIIVRAITTGVRNDIDRAFDGTDRVGDRAGQRAGRSFRRGFGRGGNGIFRDFLKESESTYSSLSKLITAGYALGPALAGGAAAISSLVSGLFALGAQAAAAGPALLGLLNVFSALIQGAAVLKLAFAGVGAALSAGLNDSGGGSKAASNAVDNTKRIIDARRRLAQAIEQAAETEERVQKSVERAWRSYQDAIISTQKAVENLRKAQKQAAEDTQQLGFDVEDAALAQEEAAVSLEEARATLAAVQSLPPDSKARQEAELAFKQADLAYRRAVDRNNDLQQSQEEANAAGSAGAEDIASAAEDVADAKRNEADAYEAYLDSIIEAERARRDSARAIIEAEEALAEAIKNTGAAGAGAGGGLSAFEKAMAKLSPEAQHFVRYLLSIQGEFKKLKAAAGKKLFPQLEVAIQNLVSNLFPALLPLLEGTGDVLGKIAVGISKTITSADNLGNIGRIWKSNDQILLDFGSSLVNVLDIMLDLMDAARPLAEDFADWVRTITFGWKNTIQLNKETGALSDTLDYAGQIARQLGRVFGNLGEAFLDIGKAASGPGSGGEMILDALEGATEKFKDLVKTISGDGTLEQFFRDSAENFISMARAVGKIAGGFIRLGNNKGVAKFFDVISKDGGAIDRVFSVLEEMADTELGQVFGDIADNLSRIFEVLADTGSIKTFFSIVGDATKRVADFVSNETVKKYIVMAAGIFAVTRAFSFLFSVALIPLKFMTGAVMRLFGAVRIFAGGLGFLVTLLGGGGLSAATTAAGAGFTGLAGALGIGLAPLIGIVAAVAAVIAILIGAYTQSEIFRKSLSDMVETIKGPLLEAWNMLTESFRDAFDWMGGDGADAGLNFLDVLKKIGDFIGTYLVPLLRDYLVFYIKYVSGILSLAVRQIGGLLNSAYSYIQGFIEGIRPYIDEFAALWTENVQPVIDTFTSWFSGTIGPGITAVFEKIGSVITKFWDFVQPVFRWLGQIIGSVIGRMLVFYFKIAIGYFKILGSAVLWLWNNIISPVFKFIGGLITNYLVPAFTSIWEGFQKVIDFLKPLFDTFKNLFGGAKDETETASGGIGSAFGGISDAFQGVVDFLKGLFDKFTGMIETVGGAIADAFSPITTAFQAVVDLLRPLMDLVIGIFRTGYLFIRSIVQIIIAVFQTILYGFQLVWSAMQTYWNTTVVPLFETIGTFIEVALAIVSAYFEEYVARPFRDAWNNASNFWNGTVVPFFTTIQNAARVLVEAVRIVFNKIAQPFKDAWNSIKDYWNNTVVPLITTFKNSVSEGFSALGALFDKHILLPFRSAWDGVKAYWNDTIYPFLSGLQTRVSEIASAMWSGLSSGLNTAVSSVKSVLNALISGWNSVIGAINNISPPGVDDIDPIPLLAQGGVVRPTTGGRLVRVAEAGRAERVEPLDSSGLSKRDRAIIAMLAGSQGSSGDGMTINVYPSAGMDERELAAQVSRQIRLQMRKGAA